MSGNSIGALGLLVGGAVALFALARPDQPVVQEAAKEAVVTKRPSGSCRGCAAMASCNCRTSGRSSRRTAHRARRFPGQHRHPPHRRVRGRALRGIGNTRSSSLT